MKTANTVPANDTHVISLEKAVEMTTVYRNERENILADAYKNQDIIALSETFNRNAFDSLLAEEDCAGIRLYMGMDDGLKVHAIFVGVNQNNEDILPAGANNLTTDAPVVIIEEGQRCPVVCPPGSPLNK